MSSPDGQVSGMGRGAPLEIIGAATFGPGIAIPTTSQGLSGSAKGASLVSNGAITIGGCPLDPA
jgi:hypothetical protein